MSVIQPEPIEAETTTYTIGGMEYRTFSGWSDAGWRVKRGQTAHTHNAEGRAIFSREQVWRPPTAITPATAPVVPTVTLAEAVAQTTRTRLRERSFVDAILPPLVTTEEDDDFASVYFARVAATARASEDRRNKKSKKKKDEKPKLMNPIADMDNREITI